MYVEIVSGGQPFTAGRVCLKKKLSFAPWVYAVSIETAAPLQTTAKHEQIKWC